MTEQSPSSGEGGTSADSPSVETERIGSFQVMKYPRAAGWGMPVEARAVMYPVTFPQEYRSADDPCITPQNVPQLPVPRSEGLKGLKTRGDDAGPNGIRLVYRGQAAELQEAFARITEQMALCVADVAFQEQGRDGSFRVQMLDNAAVGAEQVAARVSDVGPNMSGVGWTAQYYWIGFARDGDTLAAVQLRERWEGTGAEDWPEQYPQPTLADEELTTQLAAALASTR